MTRKFGIGLMGSLMAGALMLAAPAVAGSAEKNVSEDVAQTIQRMETHWRILIRERDPAKRKALIAEHRQMMTEAKTALGAKPDGSMDDHGHGGTMGSDHRHDLQNTMELHSMMLDMMR